MNRKMNVTSPDQMYVHPLEFAQGSQWGEVVLQLASMRGASNVYVDPEAQLDDDGLFQRGSRIYLGSRMYTDDQIGKLDGPGRYIVKPDPTFIRAVTPLAAMTKRERRKARKARRAAKRSGITASFPVIAI